MIKTKIWVVVISLILTVSAALSVIIFTLPKENVVAIYSDGELLREIDLSEVAEPYTFKVEHGDGFNEILVERGRIRVSFADCPDRCCVDYGWYYGGASPVVCVPHKLVIKAVNSQKDDFDIVTG